MEQLTTKIILLSDFLLDISVSILVHFLWGLTINKLVFLIILILQKSITNLNVVLVPELNIPRPPLGVEYCVCDCFQLPRHIQISMMQTFLGELFVKLAKPIFLSTTFGRKTYVLFTLHGKYSAV